MYVTVSNREHGRRHSSARTSTSGLCLSMVPQRSVQRSAALTRQLMLQGVRVLLSWGASFFPEHCPREACVALAMKFSRPELANLMESELGGRRCEIVLSSRTELNGKTCVADEYLPGSNQYKATLETEKEGPVTEEAIARADQVAAELLAELGLDDSPTESSGGDKATKSKKKKKAIYREEEEEE
ncbi:hypothetical protein THAOC_29917, partial [Thalassiosira oceanica]